MPLPILFESRPLPPALTRDCALFLDVDGCLLDFHDDPDAVVAPAWLVARLQAIAQALDGALALVSGRRLSSLDRIFAPARFPLAGLHGLERRAVDGDVPPAPAIPMTLQALHADAIDTLQPYPGALVEDKGIALALHWRGAPAAGPAARAFAETALRALPGYRLQPGDHVVELRPDTADKGSAIAAFMQEAPFRGRMPVFAGDDLTDEAGFEWINASAGVSILVGNRECSGARYRLPDVAAVHRWLEEAQ